MKNLDLLLPELDNIELSKLVIYQYPKLLTNSKLKVHNELQRRHLKWEDVKILFNENIHSPSNSRCKCQKCGSVKFYTESDYHSYVNKHQTYEVVIETMKCSLCDQKYEAPHDNLVTTLKRKIQSYQSNTFKKFNLNESNLVNNNN